MAALDGVRVVACSSVYETEAVGEVPDQRDFYNAAMRIDTDLEPAELLASCKAIERAMGRSVGPPHGPRPIDLDVLLFGDLVASADRLTVPHAELCNRRFVLVPMLELDPGLRLPDGTSLRACLEALPPGQRVDRIASLEPVTG